MFDKSILMLNRWRIGDNLAQKKASPKLAPPPWQLFFQVGFFLRSLDLIWSVHFVVVDIGVGFKIF